MQLLITSTFESSEHRADSFHYQHKAIDIKEPFDNTIRYQSNTDINSIRDKIFQELKDTLGKDYDVVWHKGSHYHCEFDPD